MKNLLLTLLAFTLSTKCAKAQSNKKQFNKGEAISWLNAKMTGASSQSDVNSRGESTAHHPKFFACSYYSKLEAYKMDVYKAINNIKDEPQYYNEYSVNLQTLDPSSVVVEKGEDGKFYIKASATNSLKTVTRKIFYPRQSVPAEVIGFSDISFGPFDTGNNLEARAAAVVKKLIISCGGRKEAF
jgi:hypothetical protein